ncbi:MAG TPA: hypothetical protein VNH11_11755 [Pirellulales bacterium]|nr:hypothetical protein [Pirellulales bacterium]
MPSRVFFPRACCRRFAGAIKRNVTVRGPVYYFADQPFPKLVYVRELEIHPCDDELPSLGGLRGLAPGSTGDLSAVDFVRSLRHD